MTLKATPPRKLSKKSPAKDLEIDPEKAQQKLISAAKKLFAQRGFSASTVKDIADEAGVNVSSVSYYFEGKAGLYRACLERFGQDKFETSRRMLQPAKNIEEFNVRLEMHCYEMLCVHAEQPELVKIMLREVENGTPIAEELFRNTFLKSIQLSIEFFRSAQKEGFLRKDIDAHNMATMFCGAVLHVGQRDALNEKFFNVSIKNEVYRKEIVKSLVSILIDGIKTRDEEKV